METQPTPEQVDHLLREANILRMRGRPDDAEARCRAALELAPQEPVALEMLGDLLRGRGQLEEAAEQYRLAAVAAPNRPSPEKKYAELTLELAERQRLRDAAAMMLANPASPAQQRRNVWYAFFLSSIFPGLGQFYNHEGLKALLLGIGFLLCLGLGGADLIKIMFAVSSAPGTGQVGHIRESMGLSSWMGFLSFVLWLYSIIDAVVVAQKRGAGPVR